MSTEYLKHVARVSTEYLNGRCTLGFDKAVIEEHLTRGWSPLERGLEYLGEGVGVPERVLEYLGEGVGVPGERKGWST